MCLRISFGIMDNKLLKEYEKKVVAVRLLEMSIIGITGDFSLSHFVDIHKKILGDIYFLLVSLEKKILQKVLLDLQIIGI